jgi:TonB family protein
MDCPIVGKPPFTSRPLDEIQSSTELSRHARRTSATRTPRSGRAWLASGLIHAAVILTCATVLPDFARLSPLVVDTTPCTEVAWIPSVQVSEPLPMSAVEELLFTALPEAVLPEEREEAEPLVPLSELAEAEAEEPPAAAAEAVAENNAAPDALADASSPAAGTLADWLTAQARTGGQGGSGEGNGSGDGGDGVGGIGRGGGIGEGGSGTGRGGNGGHGSGTGTGSGPGTGTPSPGRGAGLGAVTRRARPAARLEPAYPERQRLAGRTATVLLLVQVNASGQADRIEVLTPEVPEDFVRSATSAARAMRYEPALEDDQPIPSAIRVRIEYRLDP